MIILQVKCKQHFHRSLRGGNLLSAENQTQGKKKPQSPEFNIINCTIVDTASVD